MNDDATTNLTHDGATVKSPPPLPPADTPAPPTGPHHRHHDDIDPPPRSRRPFQPSKKHIAIALQGGGSHAAFAAGALARLLQEPGLAEQVVGLSGTSGGSQAAAIGWAWLHHGRAMAGPNPTPTALAAAMAKMGVEVATRLENYWKATAVQPYDLFDQASNQLTLFLAQFPFKFEGTPYQIPNSWWADFAQRKTRMALAAALPWPWPDLPYAEDLAGIPSLLIGATEILTGEGRAIRGAEANIEHLLASATLPELFPAHQLRFGNRWDGTYWDGLFAMNPPVAEFISSHSPELPDEIWVIRINPKGRVHVPKTWGEIADRRNELSGNLSLEKEIEQILHTNELVRRGPIRHPRRNRNYKEIKVRELWLREGQIGRPMTLDSKSDRSADFIDDLFRHGRAQADEFLACVPARVA